jgi:hypothetical protein
VFTLQVLVEALRLHLRGQVHLPTGRIGFRSERTQILDLIVFDSFLGDNGNRYSSQFSLTKSFMSEESHSSTLPSEALRLSIPPIIEPTDSNCTPSPRQLSFTQHIVLYSTSVKTLPVRPRPMFVPQTDPDYQNCKSRFSRLVKTATPKLPPQPDISTLITAYIELCRLLAQERSLDRRIKLLEIDNRQKLRQPPPLTQNPDFQRQIKLLRAQLRETEERARRFQSLPEIPPDPFAPQRSEMNKTLATEREEVEELRTAVDHWRLKNEAMERRLFLMNQRKSGLSNSFTENPDPALKAGDRLDDLVRRFVD